MTEDATRVHARERTDHRGAHERPSQLHSHWAVAGMSVGVLAVAVGYAMSRAELGGASALYWLGQLLIFGAALSVALHRGLTTRAAQLMVIAFGVATAFTKWMYSPFVLKFPDELQHLLGTANLMANDAFGAPNRTLAISPQYPGLETIGSVVCRATGMSIDAAGLMLGAVFHVATVCLMFALLRHMTGSLRAGTLAVLAYGCNASFGFFNSMYVYENLSVVFALAALLAVMSLARTPHGAPRVLRSVFAALMIVATIVSHHVTAAGLCLALVVFSVIAVRRRGASVAEGGAWVLPVALTAGAIGLTLAWFTAIATRTWSYIAPYTVGFVGTSSTPSTPPQPGHGRRLLLPSSAPAAEVGLAAVGLLVLFLICAVAAVVQYRRTRRIPVTYLVGAAALGALEVGRLVSGRGSEVAGRSAAFVYVPVAAAVGAALFLLLRPFTRRRRAIAGVLLCLGWVGGILIAWPAWWDRLPGGGLVATQFERGSDPAEIAAARWVARALPADQPIAADLGGLLQITTRAGHVGKANAADVFYAPTMSPKVRAQLKAAGIRYVWVNTKMPHTYSLDNKYYGSQNTYTTAPTAGELAKFDQTPGVNRVYDNGEIIIYNVIPYEAR